MSDNVNKNITSYEMKNVANQIIEKISSKYDDSYKISKEDILLFLDDYMQSLDSNTLTKRMVSESSNKIMQDKFWQFGNIVIPDTDYQLFLRCVDASDRDNYILLQREYSILKSLYNEESYCDTVWEQHIDGSALMLSIIYNNKYIGYCGIKNTLATCWEIAIELMPEWTNRGIGTKVIPAMLDSIKTRLSITTFSVKIEPTNYPSQRLFEKIGAIPNGISALWVRNEKTLETIENTNLNQIDEKIINTAEKFGVEPRKLLSHVLEYKLTWN